MQLRKVLLGRCVADGDVDLALGENKIGDLVVLARRQALTLQTLFRVDVVHVAAIQDQVLNGDITRQETLSPSLTCPT
jgi:hypothetical protein